MFPFVSPGWGIFLRWRLWHVGRKRNLSSQVLWHSNKVISRSPTLVFYVLVCVALHSLHHNTLHTHTDQGQCACVYVNSRAMISLLTVCIYIFDILTLSLTPKSDQVQISPAASPEILHHTVWRTWLFIAYSDWKMIIVPILLTSLVHFSL